MEDVIYQGPHVSVLQPVATKILTEEVTAKEKKGQRKVVLWDSIKENPHEELKISPIPIIPHKSQNFRAILDLSFALRLKDGELLLSVNDLYVKTAPQGYIYHLVHSLMRTIHAFAHADENMKNFMAKWDIKDGFWHLNYALGK